MCFITEGASMVDIVAARARSRARSEASTRSESPPLSDISLEDAQYMLAAAKASIIEPGVTRPAEPFYDGYSSPSYHSEDEEDQKSALDPETMDTVFPDTDTAFETEEEAILSLDLWAKDHGFEEKGATKSDNKRVLYRNCHRSGKPDHRNKRADIPVANQRGGTRSKKIQCPFKLKVVRGKGEIAPWKIVNQEPHHNHGPAPLSTMPKYRRRALDSSMNTKIINWAKSGLAPKQILAALADDEEWDDELTPLTARDISNIIARNRTEYLAGRTPIQWLLAKLREEHFHPRVATNGRGQVISLLFIPQESLRLWREHHSILLMDSTYKTNKFNMPMLNIGAVTDNNMTIQVGVCFLHQEIQETYEWVLQQLTGIMKKHRIPLPRTIITDREKALINALVKWFPDTKHILCQWHVAQNVKLITKKWFPAPEYDAEKKRKVPNPQHVAFLTQWRELVESPTQEEYVKRRAAFRTKGWPYLAIEYCEGWLVWDSKLVACYVDRYFNAGNKTTSRLEGLHAVMKAYIQVSSSDLALVFTRLLNFWRQQHRNIEEKRAYQATHYLPMAHHEIFTEIRMYVSEPCLQLIWHQKGFLASKIEDQKKHDCSGNWRASRGVPCWGELHELRVKQQPLTLDMIDSHWHVRKPKAGAGDIIRNSAGVPIQGPGQAIVGGRKKEKHGRRPGGGRGGDSGTQRILSQSLAADQSIFDAASSLPPASTAAKEQDEIDTRGRALRRDRGKGTSNTPTGSLKSTSSSQKRTVESSLGVPNPKRSRTPSLSAPLATATQPPKVIFPAAISKVQGQTFYRDARTGETRVLKQPNRPHSPPIRPQTPATISGHVINLTISPPKPANVSEVGIGASDMALIDLRFTERDDIYVPGTMPAEASKRGFWRLQQEEARKAELLKAGTREQPMQIDSDSEDDVGDVRTPGNRAVLRSPSIKEEAQDYDNDELVIPDSPLWTVPATAPTSSRQIGGVNESQLSDRDAEGETQSQAFWL